MTGLGPSHNCDPLIALTDCVEPATAGVGRQTLTLVAG